MKSVMTSGHFVPCKSIIRLFLPLLLFSSLHSALVFGQGQANVWYMGNGAGLDFNTVPPTKLQDGNVGLLSATGEGVGAMASTSGGLLFYTNGSTVYNKNHVAMPNGTGLNGNGTTTQTGTIVPVIGNSNQYYIISPADNNAAAKYSIVDMTLNGGLGDVVVASKNINLLANASESCLVIPHSNGTDFWVLLHASTVNTYHVFLFTSSGITGPTNYNIGGSGQATMSMKVNSCYNQIASVFYNQTRVEVVSFNNTTGAVSATGMISVTNFFNPEVYGAEFSPNGRFLYVSESGLNGRKTVYQFDLQAGSAAAINASRRYYTGDAAIIRMGALQLGPDAKIYIPGYTTVAPSYMSVIPSPDVQWTSPNPTASEFEYLKYTFNVKRVGEGLPPVIRTLLTTIKILSSNACEGGTTNFSFVSGSTASSALGSITWDFGDGSAPVTDQLAPTHTYSLAGTYTVTVSVMDLCNNTRIGTVDVIIKTGPQVSVPSNACPFNDVVLTGTGTNAANYTWSNNANMIPVIATGASYTYNGTLPKTIYVEDPSPLATYTTGNPLNPPNGNAGADVGHTYFDTYQTLDVTSFQIYSRASGSANLSLQNEGGTITYWGPVACNPTAAGQTFTFTPNATLAAGKYRLFTTNKTPFFRENNSADGNRDVNNVIDVLGEKSGTKGGSFLNIIITLPDPCGVRTYVIADGCAISQPVELSDFSAVLVEHTTQLSWVTESELNSDYFIVEKSSDGISFSELTRVPAAGFSTSQITYTAEDPHPFFGKTYYRLAQIDIDGSIAYSTIKEVDLEAAQSGISVYPNPAQNIFTVELIDQENFNLTIFNASGKVMANEVNLSGRVQIHCDDFADGLYLLQINSKGRSYSQKVIVGH